MATTKLPPRDDTDGRGTGAGNWWEREVRDTYRSWDWDAARGAIVWGHEIDVVAADPDVPSSKRVVQCKDWQTAQITPTTMWRLITMAYTTGSQPVLATTTDLTDRAERIARHWRVRILTPVEIFGDSDEEPRPSRPLTGGLDGGKVERLSNPEWDCRLRDSHADDLLRARQRYAHTSPSYTR